MTDTTDDSSTAPAGTPADTPTGTPTDVAVITGGAGGMGLATARKLGGDHVIVLSDVNGQKLRTAADSLTAEGITVYVAPCDITDRASVAALFETASSHGHVRAVVHAAGVSPQMGDPDFIIRVNGLGTVNITREYLRTAREGDALVNVASIAGHMSPTVLQPTRIFARALTDVDAFVAKMTAATKSVPAASRSGMAYSVSKSFDTDMGQLAKDHGSGTMVEYAALKRFGRPEEIAAVLAFAVSREPGYLTGTDILVDGGNRAGLGLRGMLDMAKSQ